MRIITREFHLKNRQFLNYGLTPNNIRCTAATNLYRFGWTSEQIKEFMGHSNVITTEKFYIKATLQHEIEHKQNRVKTNLPHLDTKLINSYAPPCILKYLGSAHPKTTKEA